tara:strand:- start:1104 stop:1553 length:450 start_codon:yes stop_codon:yes gene_type:complete
MKSKCIIVDIDGTIALMEGRRSPFEWDKVGYDSPNEWVINLVLSYIHTQLDVNKQDTQLIFLSGRSAECYELTDKWLKENGFKDLDYLLFMRPTYQLYEKDAKVKLELYREHIEPFYAVDIVFDDRQQVVDMWRNALGFNVCQVAEGNF